MGQVRPVHVVLLSALPAPVDPRPVPPHHRSHRHSSLLRLFARQEMDHHPKQQQNRLLRMLQGEKKMTLRLLFFSTDSATIDQAMFLCIFLARTDMS